VPELVGWHPPPRVVAAAGVQIAKGCFGGSTRFGGSTCFGGTCSPGPTA
jgi:hypothetical protein